MNPANPIVFVVDDDPAVRTSMERLIRSVGWKAETFPSADAFLERLPSAGTCCLLLDVHMPGTSGTGLQDMMCAQDADLPVVFLTGQADVPTCAASMKKGAVDFLLKPVDDELLLDALRRGLERHAAQCEHAARRDGVQSRVVSLSPRERQVMDGVLCGRLNKQIAGDMQISEKTVKVHRARVMEKMGVRSVAELVSLCGADIVARASAAQHGEAAPAG
jgi:FixJ family two-component response regulator